MQLTKFTDYALRTLMVLALVPEGEVVTIALLSQQLAVSENHLVKVVHTLGKKGWVRTVRGVGGGVLLFQDTLRLPLGDLIFQLEVTTELVDCNVPPCAFRGVCALKGVLDQASKAFFESLNQYCLQGVVQTPQTQQAIQQTIRWL